MANNIIFYFTDQQRWDTCGCYGQPLDITPNLDKLAAEGVKFENAFTPQPVCGPCRALFQTGMNNTNAPGKELKITQELRQAGYDNKTTTDDHGMHIYGIAKDQNGTKYYMVKNSWGETGKYKGIWYVSEAFVQYKTMNIVVNKNAIPAPIRKKLGL